MTKFFSKLAAFFRYVRQADAAARARTYARLKAADVDVPRFNPATGLPLGPGGLDTLGLPPGASPRY